MALRKPGELFSKDGEPEKESSTDVSENIDEIKQEFTQYSWNHNKIEELRRQVDNVSSSLNYGLSEVVDKNLNFLNNLGHKNYLTPAYAGLICGIIAIKFPEVTGIGSETINNMLIVCIDSLF